ncbi:MAG: hypothetical protein ABI833_21935 [Acidobacteriota bacterium]
MAAHLAVATHLAVAVVAGFAAVGAVDPMAADTAEATADSRHAAPAA